ncbi:MAG: glycosyltransferase family 2 protein [Lachnospiraceae bacterium]|nr:glycosyltransferase family 2 protein [Lachnospiraceae bacterium]MCM1239448.1 glycosyltransferase family 2 protein [Lachnospiraceae bacterium]MCM1304415.1 glycosyltransferase family 2 protein [Butyrivibrio sp.]MCM1411355.1 glycosyltransferase family 2 protein [Lachnospiraceae bacterium]
MDVKYGEQKDLLIIMPAYNEEQNIPEVLKQLSAPEIKEIADVLVMNDASSDSTNWIVKKQGFKLVTNVFNLGYGSAIQLGYKYAVRRKYKYIIQMDADGQHDVCNIPSLYRTLRMPGAGGECPDIVLGSRFMEGSGDFPISLSKKIAYALFRRCIRMTTGRWISDPTTGLQGLSSRAALFYSKFGNFDNKYPDANMLIQMLLLGYQVVEVPAVMHNRSHGVSMHSGLKPFVYMFRMMFSIMAVVFRIKVLHIGTGAKKDDIFFQ